MMSAEPAPMPSRKESDAPFADRVLVPLVRQFVARAAATPAALALAVYPSHASHASTSISWGEWQAASRAIAVQMLQSGVATGDRVAVLAGNRPLWPIADMAIQMIGAVGVGIYPTSTPSQVESLLMDSGATFAFAAGDTNRRTLQNARRMLGRPMPMVVDAPAYLQAPDAIADADDDGARLAADDRSWDAWLVEGAQALATHADLRAALEARTAAVRLDDLAALIYTSGSTGVPKGACISHRYLAASAASIAEVLALEPADRALSFLPYSHAAERVFGQCTRIMTGMSAALIEDPADLFAVAKDFEPTLFGGLPRVFERLYEAADVARREGNDPRAAITARIGTKCRLATSGGAALPGDIAADLAALGLPIIGAYGQTEHLCVAMHRPSRIRFDSVGHPMPGTRVRIADDGELLVARSALTFSGYWGDPEATRAAFTDDGVWLRTGDRASIDADGALRITGRVKELIALSTGRKIAPIPIEAALVSSPFIAHAVCHGEGRKYLTALLSLRRPVVEAWARSEGLSMEWPALVQHPRVLAVVQDAVSRVNADLARTDRVQRFAVTGHEFTLEGGELTPTLKVMRRTIGERFAGAFDALYAAAGT